MIQNCPIDVRRPLYKNIVLSGGSTMFKDFGRRLQRDIKRVVDVRLKTSEQLSGGKLTVWLFFNMWLQFFLLGIWVFPHPGTEGLFIIAFLFLVLLLTAETYRRTSGIASYATLCGMVWWKSTCFNGKCHRCIKLNIRRVPEYYILKFYCSPSFIKCVIPKLHMKNMGQVFVGTIQSSGLWHNYL